MRIAITLVVLLACLPGYGCAKKTGNYWDLSATDDYESLNLSFDGNSRDYRRTSAEFNQTRQGWVEKGVWKANDESGEFVVMIYVATLFNNTAFQKKHVKTLQEMTRVFTGNSFLEFDDQGEIGSNSGPIEYVFYRASGQPCAMIRKFWSDPRLAGDINQLAEFEWIAGTSFIYAYSCKPEGEVIRLSDLHLLFDGVKARNLYWPDDMFVKSDDVF